MSDTNGKPESALIALTGRKPSRKGSDLCTRDEAAAIAQACAVKVTEHYLNQIPALVATVVEAALRAYNQAKCEQMTEALADVTISSWAQPGAAVLRDAIARVFALPEGDTTTPVVPENRRGDTPDRASIEGPAQ